MNMFARFDENPAMTLQDIKETKRYGRTDAQTDARTDGQHENSKALRTDGRTHRRTHGRTTWGGGGDKNNGRIRVKAKKMIEFYHIMSHLRVIKCHAIKLIKHYSIASDLQI